VATKKRTNRQDGGAWLISYPQAGDRDGSGGSFRPAGTRSFFAQESRGAIDLGEARSRTSAYDDDHQDGLELLHKVGKIHQVELKQHGERNRPILGETPPALDGATEDI